MNLDPLRALAQAGFDELQGQDPELADLVAQEQRRQGQVLNLVAAASPAAPSVLICQGTTLSQCTAEGYPGGRYHGGSSVIDEIEELAIARAKQAFGARHANVQPHSGSSANVSVLFGLLRPGDTIMGLEQTAGGHLTHGSAVSIAGRVFRAVTYGVGADGRLDLDEVERLAREHRPRLLFAGATAYPRTIDFAAFRRVADQVGALLVADISHISGLVAAGLHPSPIDHAHVTTTSTYKQLGGPRGGLILLGRDAGLQLDGQTLAELIQRSVFPLTQGTPNFAAIAAKARALHRVVTPSFAALMQLTLANARRLAERLSERGHRLCTGGTDTHLVLIETIGRGLTGKAAQWALEQCNVVANKNRIPGDSLPAAITSGLRLGTNWPAARGMGPEEMDLCAAVVDEVLAAAPADEASLEPSFVESMRRRVTDLCGRF